MHLDATQLRHFYYRTQLGRRVQKNIRDIIVRKWPDTKGKTVAGFGFAVPLLRPFLQNSRRVLGLMPGPQGVMAWPAGEPNLSVLCDESLWPIADGFIDKLIVMHGLETSDVPSALLHEIWRCLSDDGTVIFITPNRSGLWSRSDCTPFGYGRPYLLSQLENQLTNHQFAIKNRMSSLYQPASHSPIWQRFGPACETLGQRLHFLTAGGVLIVEAKKQYPAPTRTGIAQRIKRPLFVLQGLTGGQIEPAHYDA